MSHPVPPLIRIMIRTGELDELVTERAAKLGWNAPTGTRFNRVSNNAPKLRDIEAEDLIRQIVLSDHTPPEAVADLFDEITRKRIEVGHFDGAVHRRLEILRSNTEPTPMRSIPRLPRARRLPLGAFRARDSPPN